MSNAFTTYIVLYFNKIQYVLKFIVSQSYASPKKFNSAIS